MEKIIIERINCLEHEVLQNAINKLKSCGVNLFNERDEFIFEDFRNDYFKTYNLLLKNDIPVNGVRYQLAYFMSAVQVIVGIRNFGRFLSGR